MGTGVLVTRRGNKWQLWSKICNWKTKRS